MVWENNVAIMSHLYKNRGVQLKETCEIFKKTGINKINTKYYVDKNILQMVEWSKDFVTKEKGSGSGFNSS